MVTTEPEPLSSTALGTGTSDLIRPCRAPGQARYRKPEPPAQGPPLAVAFSGGGFRATLAALGVGRFLAEAGLLGNVRCLSSVSGGSIAHGMIACAWNEFTDEGFTSEAYDRLVLRPVVERISEVSLQHKLVRNLWRTVGRKTRTDLLADSFDRWFFQGRKLVELSEDVRFIFNAANITSGVRFGFERDVVGDWVMGRTKTPPQLRVAQAVAASAAVPGAFAPVRLDVDLPCANGRKPLLLDGGVYDNLGMEAIDPPPKTSPGEEEWFQICLGAGGLLRVGRLGGIPIVRDLSRSNALLYRQTMALRMRSMVERFQVWEIARRQGAQAPRWGRRGVLFSLATVMPDWARRQEEWRADWLDARPEAPWKEIRELALTKTTFNRLDRELCERLIRRGWWLTGATISLYHREVLGTELPVWRSL